jgi:hypothetical protein
LWGGGFPWGIPALLAISWVTADRCNWRLIWGSIFELFPVPNVTPTSYMEWNFENTIEMNRENTGTYKHRQ